MTDEQLEREVDGQVTDDALRISEVASASEWITACFRAGEISAGLPTQDAEVLRVLVRCFDRLQRLIRLQYDTHQARGECDCDWCGAVREALR